MNDINTGKLMLDDDELESVSGGAGADYTVTKKKRLLYKKPQVDGWDNVPVASVPANTVLTGVIPCPKDSNWAMVPVTGNFDKLIIIKGEWFMVSGGHDYMYIQRDFLKSVSP